MTDDDDWPTPEVHTIHGVDGDVQFIVNGGVHILHTGDQPVYSMDMLFARQQPGRPVELNRDQAFQLAHTILRALGETPA